MLTESADLTDRHAILETDYKVTAEQIASLNEHGWASIPGLLDKAVVEELRVALGTVKGWSDNAGYTGLSVAYSAGWQSPVVRAVATSRRLASTILGLSEQETTIFAQDVSFFKNPGSPTILLHQDSAHFPFDRKGCLTLWVALVDMTEDMGTLHYLDGSHLEGPLGFVGDPEIREAFPELKKRKIVAGGPIAAGDARAHWDLTVHASTTNNGTYAREAWAARYIRPDTIYNGVGHKHFDRFKMKQGDRFVDHPDFPLLGMNGLIEKSEEPSS
jgi:hypothetical protein